MSGHGRSWPRFSRRRFILGTSAALGGAAAFPLLTPTTASAARAGYAISPNLLPVAPRASGEIVVAVSERMLTLDPANHYSISATTVLRHIFDTLVDVTSGSQFVPALAESWEAMGDTTWIVKLRQGVTFHDGSPFNADSVVYTLTRVRDTKDLIKSFVYQDLDQVEKMSDYEVKITTKQAFGSLPSHLTMMGMLPVSAKGNEEAFFQKPVGTGPYKFQEWTRGENITLMANPNYWKSGSPKIEKATYRFIPEISTRAAGLRSGEFDIIDRVTPDLVATLKGSPGVQVMDTPAVEAQQWIFQLAKSPVNNTQLRKAISLGIDRDAIIKELLLGYGVHTVCPTPPKLIGHVDLGVKRYDPDEAKSLAKSAGYDGTPLDFVLMKDLYPKQLEIAQAVASMLDEVGIKINIRNQEIATAREARTAGNFDMFYSGWAHMPHDPDWYFGQWFTKAGAAALNRYNNEKVEALIMQARKPDRATRQASYEELQRVLWLEEEPTIWPYYSVAIYGVRDRVKGFEARPDYYILLPDVSVG